MSVSASRGILPVAESAECFGMSDTILDLDRELDRLCEMLRNTKDDKMRAKLIEAIRDVMDRLGNISKFPPSTIETRS
jgi:hypothetical protein